MNEFLTLMTGIGLRLGLPILLTVVVVYLLGKLDARWQSESGRQRQAYRVLPGQRACWEQKGCSEEKKAQCPAYQDQGRPCWQVFRSADGRLKETCLGCKVFRSAPVPAAG